MKRLAFLSWWLVALAAASPAQKSKRTYLVIDVTGQVLGWGPWALEWQPILRGMRLPESTIVQVTANSTFSFELDAQAGFSGLHADSARIKVNRPMILRLEGNPLRKVDLSSYFIEKFPDITQSKEKPKEETKSNPLTEAWKRFAAFLPRDSRMKTLLGLNISNPADQNDAEVAVRSKKILIFTPAEGSVGVADQFPFETTVTWKKIPEPGAAYEITSWKISDPKGPPLAVTRDDYYTVKFPSPGSYFVQVSSVDGRWQSNVRRLEISTVEAQLRAASSDSSEEPKLALTLPPADFHLVAIQVPTLFTFRWEKPRHLFPIHEYELVVADRQGREMYRKKTGEEQGALPIPDPGDYQWYVEAIGAPTPSAPLERLRSDVRIFHVELLGGLARDARGNRMDPFASLFRGTAKGIFYVEGGI